MRKGQAINVGDRFGKLTVVEYLGVQNHSSMYLCKCDCGNNKVVPRQSLRNKHTQSCGCLYPKAEDLTNQRFGRLTVLKRVSDKKDSKGRSYVSWLCQCDCGNTTIVTSQNLKGSTTSCGCYQKEVAGQQTLKHGYGHGRLQRIYNGMKQRCNNPNVIGYKNYGARGISVCEEWNKPDALPVFAQWAIENGYRDELTLERIDVNGNYSPDNCTWIPKGEQSKNTRRNVFVSYKGQKLTMTDFSREIHADHRKVSRLLKQGKTVAEIEMECGRHDIA